MRKLLGTFLKVTGSFRLWVTWTGAKKGGKERKKSKEKENEFYAGKKLF